MEKAIYQGENPADIKAAQKMAKLFDELKIYNSELTTKDQLHSLNVFLSRLLFCFFAEDTGIFNPQLFTNSVKAYTQNDGSDLDDYLNKVFSIMNSQQRDQIPEYIGKFPYVNGGLFKDPHPSPKFNSAARKLLIDCGELAWSEINPDIFGSMMQAVVDSNERGGLGMHYTSVPNIMKVIEPLFLNGLKEELVNAKESKLKLERLLYRISKIKLFDPACGSGNFLIIAYKELRNLEIEILHSLINLNASPDRLFSRICLQNFYGIEINDFAHEIAKLSLWLTEHQMNMKFENELGMRVPALPLRDSGNIVCANACRIPWEIVCPKEIDDEIYIMGTPPYLGGKLQNESQKHDFEVALNDSAYPRNLY
jgi:hypothetical protein